MRVATPQPLAHSEPHDSDGDLIDATVWAQRSRVKSLDTRRALAANRGEADVATVNGRPWLLAAASC